MDEKMWFEKKRIAPTKAIRLKCLDCMCGDTQEVKACPSLNCELWGFRLGKNPFTENNLKNPFLEPRNYQGKHDWKSSKLLQHIKGCKNE